MSDLKKTIHIQIDGRDVSIKIGRGAKMADGSLGRTLPDQESPLDGQGEGKQKDGKEMDRRVPEGGGEGPASQDRDVPGGDGLTSEPMDEDVSAADVLRALRWLAEGPGTEKREDQEEKLLSHDQKNVLVGYDVACDSIMMFLANLDLYRGQIRDALVSYGYDAKDYRSVVGMVDKLFSHNALSALATGELDDGEEQEYGSAFLVYKALRDAMMDSLENSRKHIVASFVGNGGGNSADAGKKEG